MRISLLAGGLLLAVVVQLVGAGGDGRFDAALSVQSTNQAGGSWSAYSPREEIAPRCTIDLRGGRTGGPALKIDSAGNDAAFGGWQRRVADLKGGRSYRFSAWYRTEEVANERRSVIARLEWLDANDRGVRPPDYAIDVRRDGAWTEVTYTTPVPDNTRGLEVRLGLGFTRGAAWWDDIRIAEVTNAPARHVRALTVFLRPRDTGSAAASVERFCRLVESAATNQIDLVCLPEGVTVVGTGKQLVEVSESVPGPTTERLGVLAKKLRSYVVAGLYERSGKLVYNSAVLLDRNGGVAGVYRKTHLPREEWEAGITPGSHYPVFETDFGKLGMMICWDLQFPEAARALAAQGAEVIALPIWGGSETLARARAIENSVFLVSATYDMRSFILDPTGAVMAEATRDQPVAMTEIELDRKYLQPWIGDMKTRTWKEWRPELRGGR